MIKISIIIPVYNMEKYIKECLDSVLSQTLKEIEIICINDGSTDNSLETLNEYAENFKIKVISQHNQGSGAARNLGIHLARGKYVAFMDPDDFYADNSALELLYIAAEQNFAMICGGNMKTTEGNYYGKRYLSNEYVTFTGLQNAPGHQSYIYNIKFLKSNNIYYPDYRRFQDPPFLTKAMMLAKRFYVVCKDVYVYRVNHKTLKYTKELGRNIVNGMKDILEIVYLNDTALTEFACFMLNENLEYIIRFGCDSGEDTEKEMNELNSEIIKVLGKRYVITTGHMDSYRKDCKNIYEAVKNKIPIIIYGAGIIGKRAMKEIENIGGNIIGFAVSSMENNVKLIQNYSVNPIGKYSSGNGEVLIIIAVNTKLQKEIISKLDKLNFKNFSVFSPLKIDGIKTRLLSQT